MKNYLRAAVLGATAGLIVMGGAIAQERGWTPLASADSVSCYEDWTICVRTEGEDCQEDEPCWDSATMGDHRAGHENDPAYEGYPEDSTVCRWDGSRWLWDYSPVAALNLPCPFTINR